jgi:hypothetical protein
MTTSMKLTKAEAQKRVDRIVANMVAAGYPVEATNKSGHRPDYLPCDTYSGWTDAISPTGATYAEANFASVLIGGWHSKSALTRLLIEVNRAAISGGTNG